MENNEQTLEKLLDELSFKPDLHFENTNNSKSHLLIYYLEIDTVLSGGLLLNIERHKNEWHLDSILKEKRKKKYIFKRFSDFFSKLKKENQHRIINSIEKYIIENS